MALSAIEVISPAFERMTRQLFKPFRLGQWVRLAIVGLFAAEGGCRGNIPFSGGSGRDVPGLPGGGPPNMAMIAIFIATAVVIGLVVGIIFMYINSRMRFVLFDSVVAGETHVRQYWRQRGEQGFRFFIFQLLFALAGAVSFVLLIGLPIGAAFAMGWFREPREHIAGFVLGGIVLLFAFFALLVILAVVQVLIKDFVVPQMALEGCTVGEGWAHLREMIRSEKTAYAVYIGMKIVLSMAAGFVLGLATLAVIVVLLIPFGGVGVIAVIAGNAAGLTWNPLTIAMAIVGGLLALICFFVLGALIAVPAIVFFPAYSIHFFAERYPPLKAAISTGSL